MRWKEADCYTAPAREVRGGDANHYATQPEGVMQ